MTNSAVLQLTKARQAGNVFATSCTLIARKGDKIEINLRSLARSSSSERTKSCRFQGSPKRFFFWWSDWRRFHPAGHELTKCSIHSPVELTGRAPRPD